jgi:hypothetical protein
MNALKSTIFMHRMQYISFDARLKSLCVFYHIDEGV